MADKDVGMADQDPQQVANAPDPDEDDLDDLDDVLDSFQATSISPAPPTANTTSSSAPTASGPGRPTTTESKDASAPIVDNPAFAEQLQASMANLMSELDSNPNMQAEFEKMMQELIGAGAAGSDPEAADQMSKAVEALSQPPAAPSTSKPTASSTKKDTPEDFQSTIRRTMERMQASDSTAKASTASASGPQSEEDLLAQMMKELTEGGMGGAGGEEGDFNSMLMNMMAHLTNKEILYEPMKELHDNFPAWMEKNAEREKKEDLERYKEQQKLVGEIVGRFERKGYSDDNEDDREYIVERMQKMQAAGSPPPDLVGDMSAAQEALGDIDQGCPTQ
ncbi:unnamed protein product [Zymoseptoria tritici ST99CH_1A5]|uniref:Pex19-domain-containing protein n=4 Tax=Zymoseptoria tritici TaxID=1047171 RepID=A0A1X7S9B3_ZYMT9|nr:unnamed protein product [Zymoseptoria tritici ST99CH_3D7]SMR60995.1 unnamed protein product [Zymoseptoria tritici ST99CH_1E4]SMR64141.1 unnamed protein product [Zymoseptoria tritici ST99CH_3D1]SMY29487.1 unnamed protein product [Zymoseptoria tritici ST99CH_1A5]